MIIKFEDVTERDIDLILMNLFSVSKELFGHFIHELNIANYQEYKLESIEHSYADETGESDITMISQGGNNRKLGILIENKIDAPAQDKQALRYQQRGINGINAGKYDDFVVTLIAPSKYLNADTQNYPNKISYERIIELINALGVSDRKFAVSLLEHAITKKKTGYTMVPDKEVTDFYSDYISCWKENGFDKIGIMATKDGKAHPRSGGWIEFNTGIKGLSITHKTDRGYIDLVFNRCKGKGAEIQSILKEVVDDIEKYQIVDTGKSVSVRLIREPFRPGETVAEQRADVIKAM